MASVRGTRRVGARTLPRTPVVEEIVPNSGWTEDSIGHYLLVDLPGFKKEEVKFQVDSSERIIVRGERQVNDEKSARFELTFPVPMDTEVDKITGKFDGEILYVIVPKRIAKQNQESETEKAENGNVDRTEENKREGHNADNEAKEQSAHGSRREEEERRNEKAHIGGFSAQLIRKWEQESSILRSAVEVLNQNKGIVVTAVLAFSLGLYVSREFQYSTAR